MRNIHEEIAAKRELQRLESIKWAAARFGLSDSDVLWYNAGSCYDTVLVTSRDAADKVAKYVAGERANGGMLDGMPLGGIVEESSSRFRVTC